MTSLYLQLLVHLMIFSQLYQFIQYKKKNTNVLSSL